MAYPFSWLEASYQYVDINNQLYSPIKQFSGSQSLKDKSFDFKVRLMKESQIFPAVALGFRDIGGTNLFGAEYLTFSKYINNFDFTNPLESSNNFNIYELDAASNNSVDDIRNLIDQVRYPPQSGKFKV